MDYYLQYKPLYNGVLLNQKMAPVMIGSYPQTALQGRHERLEDMCI